MNIINLIRDKIGYRGVILGVSLLLSLFVFILPPVMNLEMSLYDSRLRLLRGSAYNEHIQIISIDQWSLDKIGAFPWKRSVYGDLLEKLKGKNCKGVLFDILFQEPKEEDEYFVEKIKSSDFPVFLPYSFQTRNVNFKKEYMVVPVVESLASVTGATGFIKRDQDLRGVVRKVRLAWQQDGKYLPSLDLAVFAHIKGVSPEGIRYEKSQDKNYILVGDTRIPTDRQYAIWVDYYIPRALAGDVRMTQTFPVKSFYKYLEEDAKIDVSDSLVLVGAGTPGMMDDFFTPVGNMYGVMIHGNVLNTLMQGKFIIPVPGWVNFAMILLIPVIFYGLMTRITHVGVASFISVAVLMLYGVVNGILFKNGYWLYLAQPVLSVVLCYLVAVTVQFLRTTNLFGQFVAPEVVHKMLSSEEHSKLGGEEMEVSILFSDIRGYTTLSEKISPSEVMDMLNEYHTVMVDIFQKNHGRVFDYQGDAQMVVFGAPIERKDHAVLACTSALEMEIALDKLREKWKLENREQFEIGIGICTGRVAIGMVGAEGHKQYTAIGDSTNVASRLQGQSKILGHSIIISPQTYEYIRESFNTKSLGPVELKGKSQPVEVFTVVSRKE